MVSTNQSNSGGETYKSEAHKMLAKEKQVAEGCARGLRTVEQCREWLEVEVANDARADVVGALNARKKELQDR